MAHDGQRSGEEAVGAGGVSSSRAIGFGETVFADVADGFGDVVAYYERIGHAATKMTLDVYSHVLESMQEDANNMLEYLLLG